MSLLTESCPSLTQTHSLSTQGVNTGEVTLKAQGGNVTLATGTHGELALTGDNLLRSTGDATYLKLLVNGTPYMTPLLPWDPEGSAALTFARKSMVDAVQHVLDSIAAVPSAPLKTARTMYVLAMTLATAWVAVKPSSGGATVTGVKDTWNFDHPFSAGLSQQDASTWMGYALTQFMPVFLPGYDAAPLLAAQRAWMGWSVETQQAELTRVTTAGNWSAYKAAWDTWYAYRQSDGFNTVGAYVATAADISNIATPLVVTDTADPPSNGEWTPLTLASGTTQKYLGYKWAQVVSTCLPPSAMTDMVQLAAPLFPTEAQRTAEIAVVKDITAALSDTEKVIAELWAGGPRTYTPPGQLVWMWKNLMLRFLGSSLEVDSTWSATNIHVLSFLDLAIGLFEGSRVIWDIKTTYVQARPIQEIRHRYYGTSIQSWNSAAPIAADSWVPYQMSNFVSPPFGDFSSGHSYFSQLFANCMTYWLGATIPPVPPIAVPQEQLEALSPVLHGSASASQPYATFVVYPGASEIQPSVVPATPTTLTFPTWSSLAHQIGMSRLYGGIHCISAHNASVAVANALYPVLQSAWGITKV